MTTRPYQGYPYSNPHVIDAPSVDAATASRWNNLPRRPIQPSRGNVVYVELPEEGSQVSRPNETQTDKKDREPVINIAVPDGSSSDVAGQASPLEPDYTVQYCTRTNGTPNQFDEKSNAEPDPVIYIDVPDSSSSDVAGPASEPHPGVHYYRRPNGPTNSDKKDPEPMIYIDVPDSNTSDVAGPASPEPEPEYVQETIFYDPFENRRIDRHKSPDETDSPSSTEPRRPAPPRPTPPKTLDLNSAASSGYPSTFSSPSSTLRDYGRHDDFGLPMHDRFSPTPVSPYPEPPPAYSEIDTRHTPQTPHTTYTLQTPLPERPPCHPQETPRTVVITHGSSDLNRPGSDELPSPIGLASADRKVMYCHHCGLRVNTLVILESGLVTHAIALALFCLMLIPLIVLVYWTNFCKYRNHYCPNCNKQIGYEVPALCISMTYTK